MTDPAEHLRWHEWARDAWTENRPACLEMTGDEITEFLDENEVAVTWKPASRETVRVVTLTSDAFPTMKGQTLKEAVGRAAAWLKEANE